MKSAAPVGWLIFSEEGIVGADAYIRPRVVEGADPYGGERWGESPPPGEGIGGSMWASTPTKRTMVLQGV